VRLIVSFASALALLGGVGFAVAQDSPPSRLIGALQPLPRDGTYVANDRLTFVVDRRGDSVRLRFDGGDEVFYLSTEAAPMGGRVLKYDTGAFERIIDKYLHLDLYPDALASLAAMKDRKLAILSNGSPGMLNALVNNSGLDRVLDATISVDAKKIFKPSPDAYTLIESTLGTPPADVLFISSNPWDACGAKAFGLNVAWIERVTPEAMAQACANSEAVAPLTMFKAIRTQMDELGLAPDHRIHTLSELPDLVAKRS